MQRRCMSRVPITGCIFSPSLPPSPLGLSSSHPFLLNVIYPLMHSSDLAIVTVSFLLLTIGCPSKWFPNIHLYYMNEVGLLFTFSLGQFKETTGHSVWLSLNQPQRKVSE